MKTNLTRFTSTGTTEDRFRQIDQVISSMRMRMRDSVIGLIPFTVVHGYCETVPESGIIASALLPASGRIKQGCFYVGSYNTPDMVTFEAKIWRQNETQKARFETRLTYASAKIDLEVKPGDRLILMTRSPELVSNVWASALYELDHKDLSQHMISWDEIEEILNAQSDS